MLRYSSEASKLKPVFYSFYNHLEIYVEDTGDEVFYETLFQQLLANSVKVKRVFGLGGKRKLLDALQDELAAPSGRRKLFIADGDLDRLLGTKFPKTPILHVLPAYCIENFLCEEFAIYDLMQEETLQNMHALKRQFDAAVWLKTSVVNLTPLFACYAVIQKHKLGIKNVKLGLKPFVVHTGIPTLDKNKLDNFLNSVRQTYPSLGNRTFDEELAAMKLRMGQTWRYTKRYVCGKHFLMPLLRFELKRQTGSDLKLKIFRFRMMKTCRLNSLWRLKNQILTVATRAVN